METSLRNAIWNRLRGKKQILIIKTMYKMFLYYLSISYRYYILIKSFLDSMKTSHILSLWLYLKNLWLTRGFSLITAW